jgi:predicted component of type VI protein secretion system
MWSCEDACTTYGVTISVKQLSRFIATIDYITDLFVKKKWLARLNGVKAGGLENLRTSNFQFDYQQTGFSNHCFTPQMK